VNQLSAIETQKIRSLVLDVRRQFPKALWTEEYIDREVLHVQLTYVPNGRLMDLGGGYSALSAVLARLGMDVTVVDTFGSTKFYEQFSAQELCDVLQSFGVKIAKADLRDYDPARMFEPASIDTVDCFGAIHFFNPRELLNGCMRVLKPGGNFVVDYPNAASLLRRIRLLLGRDDPQAFQYYFFHDGQTRSWIKSDVQALAAYLSGL